LLACVVFNSITFRTTLVYSDFLSMQSRHVDAKRHTSTHVTGMSDVPILLLMLQLRCVGSTLPDYMAERRNRFNWERNYIDYMGRDSFENIRRRLDEVILGEEGARCVEAAVDVLVDTGEDLVAVADVADEPALPDMSADENVMTGVDEQRSSQYFIGRRVNSVVRIVYGLPPILNLFPLCAGFATIRCCSWRASFNSNDAMMMQRNPKVKCGSCLHDDCVVWRAI
jgi:hypothetical protein